MIYNLTQHAPTPAQAAEGVGHPLEGSRPLITFDSLPSAREIMQRAEAAASLLREAGARPGDRVMIGGAPYFMGALEGALLGAGFKPVYSFTRRDCVETPLPDGTVKKEYVFAHAGWVEV